MKYNFSYGGTYSKLFENSVNRNYHRLNLMEAPYPDLSGIDFTVLPISNESLLSKYPDPNYIDLKKAIAEVHHFPKDIEIVPSNGSMDLLTLILTAIRQDFSKALLFEPVFPWFTHLTEQLGFNTLKFKFPDSLELDHNKVLETIEKEQPGLIVIISPNNPTCHVFNSDLLETIVARSNGFVLIDQIYAGYANISYEKLLTKYKNVILIDSLSKKGFAGLRFGFMACHQSVADDLCRFIQGFPIGNVTANIALEIYRNYDKVLQKINTTIVERERLYTTFKKEKDLIVLKSQTNFINFSLSDLSKNALLLKHLKDHGFLLAQYAPHSPYLPQYLRLTISDNVINNQVIKLILEFCHEN